MCEAVEVKTRLHMTPSDTEDAKVMRKLSRKIAYRQYYFFKGEEGVVGGHLFVSQLSSSSEPK